MGWWYILGQEENSETRPTEWYEWAAVVLLVAFFVFIVKYSDKTLNKE
jgi:hypothetical protein